MHIYTLLKFSRSSFSFLLPQRASLKRDSRPNLYVCMYIYIYMADEISIVSAYFGLPQCTAFGSAGYSCLINRHKANRQCDHYTRCFYHYTRCFRNYTQWFEHYTRCFQHYFYIFFPRIQLFQLIRLSTSKAEKSNMSAKGCWEMGIALKIH